MTAAGTLEDQKLMAEGKNFCLQNGTGSEAISQREQQSEHGLERLTVAAP
jgi:hypothetical protein